MSSSIRRFFESDSGAATVEFVVLTAGLIGLVLALFVQLGVLPQLIGDRISDSVATAPQAVIDPDEDDD